MYIYIYIYIYISDIYIYNIYIYILYIMFWIENELVEALMEAYYLPFRPFADHSLQYYLRITWTFYFFHFFAFTFSLADNEY